MAAGPQPEARQGPLARDPGQARQRAERRQRQAERLRKGGGRQAGRLSGALSGEARSGEGLSGEPLRQAHAKVNLWLNVVGRCADGYHLLDSLVAFVDLADTVSARPADRLSLEIDGPCAATLAEEPDNLVLKAA